MSSNVNRTFRISTLNKLAYGFEQHCSKLGGLVVDTGEKVSTTQILRAFDANVKADAAVASARGALAAALLEEEKTKEETESIVNAVKQYARIMFAAKLEVLADFGLTAPRRRARSSEEQAQTARKALAVPCDSTSTCEHGRCVSSRVFDFGDGLGPPGESSDGGDAGIIIPDAGLDGPPVDDSGRIEPYCSGGTIPALNCPESPGGPDVGCRGSDLACIVPVGGSAVCVAPTASGTRLCCIDQDCATTDACTGASGAVPGTCLPRSSPPPYCAGDGLHCFGPAGSNVMCSGTANACCAPAAACTSPSACTATSRYCCSGADCPSGLCGSGGPPIASGTPATCAPSPTDGGSDGGTSVPRCDAAGVLQCGSMSCVSNLCCQIKSTGTIGCATTTSDCSAAPLCCSNHDCPSGSMCPSTLVSTPPDSCGASPGDGGSDSGGDGGPGGASCVGGFGGTLACGGGGMQCVSFGGCCGSSPSTASCESASMCMLTTRYCCKTQDCGDGGVSCTQIPGQPLGTCQ